MSQKGTSSSFASLKDLLQTLDEGKRVLDRGESGGNRVQDTTEQLLRFLSLVQDSELRDSTFVQLVEKLISYFLQQFPTALVLHFDAYHLTVFESLTRCYLRVLACCSPCETRSLRSSFDTVLTTYLSLRPIQAPESWARFSVECLKELLVTRSTGGAVVLHSSALQLSSAAFSETFLPLGPLDVATIDQILVFLLSLMADLVRSSCWGIISIAIAHQLLATVCYVVRTANAKVQACAVDLLTELLQHSGLTMSSTRVVASTLPHVVVKEISIASNSDLMTTLERCLVVVMLDPLYPTLLNIAEVSLSSLCDCLTQDSVHGSAPYAQFLFDLLSVNVSFPVSLELVSAIATNLKCLLASRMVWRSPVCLFEGDSPTVFLAPFELRLLLDRLQPQQKRRKLDDCEVLVSLSDISSRLDVISVRFACSLLLLACNVGALSAAATILSSAVSSLKAMKLDNCAGKDDSGIYALQMWWTTVCAVAEPAARFLEKNNSFPYPLALEAMLPLVLTSEHALATTKWFANGLQNLAECVDVHGVIFTDTFATELLSHLAMPPYGATLAPSAFRIFIGSLSVVGPTLNGSACKTFIGATETERFEDLCKHIEQLSSKSGTHSSVLSDIERQLLLFQVLKHEPAIRTCAAKLFVHLVHEILGTRWKGSPASMTCLAKMVAMVVLYVPSCCSSSEASWEELPLGDFLSLTPVATLHSQKHSQESGPQTRAVDLVRVLTAQAVVCESEHVSWVLIDLISRVVVANGSQDLERDALVCILGIMDDGESGMQTCAYHAVNMICVASNLSCAELLQKYEHSVLPILVDQMISSTALDEVSRAFFKTSTRNLVRSSVRSLLPHFVFEERSDVLQQLGNIADVGLTDMVLDAVSPILSFVLLRVISEPSKLESSLRFLIQDVLQGTLTITDLVNHCAFSVLNEMAWAMGDIHNFINIDVQTFLRAVGLLDNILSDRGESDAQCTLLVSNMLGVIDFLHGRMNVHAVERNATMSSLALQALRALSMLIEALGDRIAYCIPRMLSMIRSAVECRSHGVAEKSVALKCVLALLKNISAPAMSPYISQIFVLVLPLLPECPEDVASIVNFVVIDSGVAFRKQFESLCFIPNHELICDAKKTVDQANESLNSTHHLRIVLNTLASSQNGEYVVLMTLQRLGHLLKDTYRSLMSRMSGANGNDSLVNELYTQLLKICSNRSARVRRECCVCLGILGAIDPARVKVTLESHHQEELDVRWLVVEIIESFLVSRLRSDDDSSIQDKASYTIQELLRVLKRGPSGGSETVELSPGSRNSADAAVMQMFRDDYTRQLVRPCLYTKYKLESQPATSLSSVTELPKIFKRGMKFEAWISELVCALLDVSGKGKYVCIFEVCRTMIRADTSLALHLLPYLVRDVLVSARALVSTDVTMTDVCSPLVEEFVRVLQGGDSSGSDARQPDVVGSPRGAINVEHIQTVFALVDTLRSWAGNHRTVVLKRSMKPSSTVPANVRLEDQGYEVIEHFLGQLPKKLLAKSAWKLNAHLRALRYFEEYVRVARIDLDKDNTEFVLSSEDVMILMDIYRHVDDPDGLLGVTDLLPLTSTEIESQGTLGSDVSASSERTVGQSGMLWWLRDVVEHETTGRWMEAIACYSYQLCRSPEDFSARSVEMHKRMLDCMLFSGQYQSAIHHVDGLLMKASRFGSVEKVGCSNGSWNQVTEMELKRYGAIAATRVGQWEMANWYSTSTHEAIDNLGTSYSSGTIDICFSRVLIAMHDRDTQAYESAVDDCYRAIITPLSAAARESYQRSYPYVTYLHVLHESGKAMEFLKNEHCDGMDPFATSGSGDRFDFTEPSMSTKDLLLSFRRSVYEMQGLPKEVSRTWLLWAKLNRKLGRLETASSAILEAGRCHLDNFHLQRAKLLWAHGRSRQAIDVVDACTLAFLPSRRRGEIRGHVSMSQRPALDTNALDSKVKAKTLLLSVNWNQQARQKMSDDVLNSYKQVLEYAPEWDSAYFHLARYYDTLYRDSVGEESFIKAYAAATTNVPVLQGAPKSKKNALATQAANTIQQYLKLFTPIALKYIHPCLENYSKCMQYGHRHILIALPRMLTLWLDTVADLDVFSLQVGSSVTEAISRQVSAVQAKLHDLMSVSLSSLPTYQLLTVLAQLVSRLTHRNDRAKEILRSVVERICCAYPQQALWSVVAQSKSLNKQRMEIAKKILSSVRAHSEMTRNLTDECSSLVHQVTALSLLSVKREVRRREDRIIDISREMPAMFKMTPLSVMVPLQSQFSVSLPSASMTDASFQPFPESLITIQGFQDKVEVLHSLQKPRKLIVMGSDGRAYPFLVKKDDDIRKDSRMMEFNTMINKLLMKDTEARRRRLYLRTYAVVPLSDESGIMEWVMNTEGYRHVLGRTHRTHGYATSTRDIKTLYEQRTMLGYSKVHFLHKVQELLPPVFHKWFMEKFPEPTRWFESRLAFSRTAAVWSMVGYILGLGDRHGENLLIDTVSGDCVHVDFACLFDKGKTFECPETVPFRLTPNIVDAFGITGCEGVFRRVCEISLRVLRENRDGLLTVLHTFIHDPLIEWTRKSYDPDRDPSKVIIRDVEKRLSGISFGDSLPLSVEGQVDMLIREASSEDNLSKEFIRCSLCCYSDAETNF